MFDIGFSEIVVCLVVALVVIGPERMPETVRTIGLWIGRLKRSLRETREEIERQIGVDDIRRQLHNEDIMRSLENARADIDQALQDTQQALDHEAIARNQSYTYEHNELPNHAHESTQETLIEQPHSVEPEIKEPDPHNALIEIDTAHQPTKTPL